ncbi:class I SAM-dependent methyltransferase [Streptomyces sp. NPDC017546]|uniref:class I SAM-dependent methyltransferase n=1 Tax=Streptomyces sp. NPDC017546 TaxID=3365001 RepID=UPI003790E508
MSFGEVAEVYDRVRPRCPDTALRWALGERALDVVETGAGTGSLTRTLRRLGHRCTAVEPDPRMRAVLSSRLPGLTVLHGTAEALPLPDSCSDAVVAAECYHWFDPRPAHAEAARVLRPGGLFVVMWHHRDESVPWVKALTEVLRPYDDTRTDAVVNKEPCPYFGTFREERFAFSVEHTRESLLDLYRSHSFYLAAGSRTRAFLEADLANLLDNHPDLRGQARFTLPYAARVHRSHRLR